MFSPAFDPVYEGKETSIIIHFTLAFFMLQAEMKTSS